MSFNPSAEQQAYFQWIQESTGNAIIEAVAGAGKSTTLVEGLRFMKGTTMLTAFNKKAAEDLQSKVSDQSRCEIGTVHSFGFRLFKANRKYPKLDAKAKHHSIMESSGIDVKYWWFYQQALSLAKQSGFGVSGGPKRDDIDAWVDLAEHHSLEDELPTSEDDDCMELHEALLSCPKLLSKSNYVTDFIDFDDMIYLPLVHDFPIPARYNNALLDEAQDTNFVRRLLVERYFKDRFVAVGDPYQAIYGFTGANNDSMEIISRHFNTTRLPLHTSFRCAQEVVREAQTYVPHILSHPSAPMGSVTSVFEYDDPEWLRSVQPGQVILCRNTKPLLGLCFRLIRMGKGAKVEGRKIGEGLKSLIRKFKWQSFEQLRGLLNDYRAKEVAQLKAKNKNMAAEFINDKVECIIALTDNCNRQTSAGLCEYIDTLFGDNLPGSVINLSTIHKAKGREWSTVYWYGPNKFQPSVFARQQWELDQERNLMYVAATRAKLHLRKILLEA